MRWPSFTGSTEASTKSVQLRSCVGPGWPSYRGPVSPPPTLSLLRVSVIIPLNLAHWVPMSHSEHKPRLRGHCLSSPTVIEDLRAVTAAGSPTPLGVERSHSCGQYCVASMSLGPASCHCSDPPAPPHHPRPTSSTFPSVLSVPGTGEVQGTVWKLVCAFSDR